MRASTPTIASAETTRQVNTRPASDLSTTGAPSGRMAYGSIHNNGRTPSMPSVKMVPTHNYSSGMVGVHVTHKA